MKKLAICLVVIWAAFCIFGMPPSFGQQKNGGRPVRISNAPMPRCINGTTDQVWLTLYRVIMSNKSGWFTSSNQAEIVTNVRVKTKPQSKQTLSYPLSYKVNIREYQPGQVSIPLEYNLVSGLNLKQKDAQKNDVLIRGLRWIQP
jgi:hypothetical protein